MASITKSPWIIHYDGSSCNGCDIEVLACLTPMYDVERFGIINTGNPKHADVFLVTGAVNEQNIPVVKQIYNQMPNPKVVVAVGICATSGGIFRDCYNIIGGIDKVIPVDVYVPGCAARPEAIIDGVVKGLGVLAEKQEALAKGIADPPVSGAYRYEDGAYDEDGTFLPDEEEDVVIAAAAPQSMDPGSAPGMTEEAPGVTEDGVVIAAAEPQSMDPGSAPGMTDAADGLALDSPVKPANDNEEVDD